MSNLASVRAEIKTWERAFKDKEGRDPSTDDIRKLPHIVQKYRLYKQLLKAASSQPLKPPKEHSSSQSTTQSPSTPTRPSRTRIDHTSLANLSSRVITSTAPLSTFNPFSPQKAKGKERERPASPIAQPIFNPFTSPSKSRSSGKHSSQLALLQSPDRPPVLPTPPSAVVRARKRLRGEPVSPSPSKEKRQKTVSQTTLNFPRLNLALKRPPFIQGADLPDDDESDEELFIDDSPAKPSGGRKFSLLFDEARAGSKTDLFGLNASAKRQLSTGLLTTNETLFKSSNGSISSMSSQDEPDSPISSRPHTRLTSPMEELELSREIGDTEGDFEEPTSARRSKSPLLPPSPPASASTTRAPMKGKRKADAKGLSKRKKAKLARNGGSGDEDSTSDSSDLKAQVKIVNRPQVKKANADDDDLGPDFDPVLDLTYASRPDGFSSLDPQLDEAEMVEINLPNKLKDVLDLDTTRWKDHEVDEDKLVKGLIYGRRMAAYDPKRGEIWDVGEDEMRDDEDNRQSLDEDWEGEPVPWELAEL